jgi:hypothetical protein
MVTRCLDRLRPDLMLTGTSRKELVLRDGQWWRAGAARDIPTVALLDHWVGYREKFSAVAPYDHLPDVVAVMDEYARQCMLDFGCPADRLVVTGQPALDGLLGGELSGRIEVRRRWNVGSEDWVVLFASEPVSQDFGNRFGYDEQTVLRAVLEAVRGLPMTLVVRPHPREARDRLQAVVDEAGIPVRYESNLTSRQTLAGADTVVGMTSIFLLEAALAGRPVLSVQPGEALEWTGHFQALVMTVKEQSQIRQWLSDSANRRPLESKGRAARNLASGFVSGATQRVWALLAQQSERN